MNKFKQGDIVVVTDSRCEGATARIENWRGGRVAPYVVRILKTTGTFYKAGELTYLSGRDMELKDMCMSGKKKVWCCHAGCNTYSFEDKGILKWECFKHYPNNFNKSGELKDCEMDDFVTLEQKIDMLFEHFGLDIEVKPQKVVLVQRKVSNGKKATHKKH